ncbi:hypothetical protein [Fibrella arboris]|uniref:hypothetical protein n=1 Tax=Fibrella arboris TaxID=3242486 RepID=UPI0035214D03
MSKQTTQPTVRDTADNTKKHELNTNLPGRGTADEDQGKTSRGVHKSKQSTEDDHAPAGRQQTPGGKTKTELADERGPKGHGHKDHSDNE